MKSINIMVASLALGGAERIFCEIIASLRGCQTHGNAFVLCDLKSHYQLGESVAFPLHSWNATDRHGKLLEAASRVLRSGNNLLFTHLVSAQDLQMLSRYGVRTVPVIHNAREGWQNPVEAYAGLNIPFLVAVSNSVAMELRDAGCPLPVITIRHELQRWCSEEAAREHRAFIRFLYGIADDTFLIGMVGSFKAQKAYPRAARVLAQMRKLRDTKLMIVGSWDHNFGYGRVTFNVFRKLVEELGLRDHVLLPGSVDPIDPYYSAFDAYLNTSVYEGLSIALLEAQQWGCPVITADAGGNAEVIVPGSALVRDPSDTAAYVDALLNLPHTKRAVAERPAYPDLVPRMWSLLGTHGATSSLNRSGVLFVTNNLNIGGAQRSLTNLLLHIPDKTEATVCVLGAVNGRRYVDELTRASIPLITFDRPANVLHTAERLLDTLDRLNPRTLCFWNVDASVKLLVTKILACTDIRIVDVSPGWPLFKELDETCAFQQRIAYTESEYVARLDKFVCKCHAGKLNPRLQDWRSKVVVIPNGVPAENPDYYYYYSLTAPREPTMRVGTCCRLAPENRIEFLLDSFAAVSRHITDATLTIVGEAQAGWRNYKQSLLNRAAQLGPERVQFVGAADDVRPYLRSFRVFVTAFDSEGCPNAVLESMAAGTPVIATASPSNQELIRSGVDGFVVSSTDPQDMAAKIELLLTRPTVAESIGREALSTVRQRFSMEQMVSQYRAVLAS